VVEVTLEKHKPWQIITIIVLLLVVGGGLAFFFGQLRATQQLDVKLEDIRQQVLETNVNTNYDDGFYEEAIAYTQEYLSQNPDDIGAMLKLATVYLQQGSVEFAEEENAIQALMLLNKVLALEPKNVTALRLVGYAYEIQEQYSDAETAYTKALEILPADADTLASRGHMYDLMGELEKAEGDYKAALSSNPDHVKALLDLSSLYIRTEKTEFIDVERMLDQALALADEDVLIANIFQTFGVLYSKREEYSEARLLFYDALEYDDRLTSAWLGAAFAELMLADVEDDELYTQHVDDAITAIEEAFSINRNLAHIYVLQAIVASYVGDAETEKEMYETALTKIEGDITLGRSEKDSLRDEITTLLVTL